MTQIENRTALAFLVGAARRLALILDERPCLDPCGEPPGPCLNCDACRARLYSRLAADHLELLALAGQAPPEPDAVAGRASD